MRRAGEEHEIENKDLQDILAYQRAMQKLVISFRNLVKGFYERAALMQTKSAGDGQSEDVKVCEKNETDRISALKTLDAAIATLNAPTASSCADAAQAT